jgi:hypothetical protein
MIAVASMVMNFWGKKGGGGHGHGPPPAEMQMLVKPYHDEEEDEGDVELAEREDDALINTK